MAYIGRGTDKISNIEKLDTITFDGSQSYTLQKNSVNFVPNSANSLQVSIDGVVQAGNFTVSGSTIDFGVAIPSTSTCDFIFHYGTGLITTPADGTVSLDKLSATGTKDSTTFLRGDNTFQTIGTNTPAFLATRSSNQSIPNATYTKVQFDTEVFDTDSCYDNSTNYRFTPTVAGKYFVTAQAGFENFNGTGHRVIWTIYKNGSAYSIVGDMALSTDSGADPALIISTTVDMNGSSDYLEVFVYQNSGGSVNIINTSTYVKFQAYKIIE